MAFPAGYRAIVDFATRCGHVALPIVWIGLTLIAVACRSATARRSTQRQLAVAVNDLLTTPGGSCRHPRLLHDEPLSHAHAKPQFLDADCAPTSNPQLRKKPLQKVDDLCDSAMRYEECLARSDDACSFRAALQRTQIFSDARAPCRRVLLCTLRNAIYSRRSLARATFFWQIRIGRGEDRRNTEFAPMGSTSSRLSCAES